MEHHLKEVLDSCKNYDFIVNYNVSDTVSQGLIKFYQDYVFFNWSSSKNIELLDTIIFTYITDQRFNEYVYNLYLKSGDIIPVFETLVKLYNEYEDSKFKMVDNTIWI